MTDEQLLPELDARGASAATALRAYVDGLELPVTPHRRPHHRGLLVAAALLVVALAAGAAWVAGRDHGDNVKTVDHPSPLYLFPDHVPVGFRLSGAGDLATSSSLPAFAPADVYTNDGSDEVLVTWTMDLGPGQLTSPDGDPVSVNGHPGTSSTSGDFRGISFRPSKQRIVTVAGRGAVTEHLLELVQRATTRGDEVVFPDGALPDGLERLGSVPLDRLALTVPYNFVGGGQGLAWASPSFRRMVIVTVQDAGPIDDEVLGLFDRDVEHRSVAGHDAVVSRSTQAGSDSRAVAWIQDGHLVRVVVNGLPQDEAIRVAGSLREITRAEYDQRSAVEPPPGTEVFAEGGEGAGHWQVSRDADRSLCVERGADTACHGPDDVGYLEVNDDADPTLVIGIGPKGSKVDVLAGSRSALAADPVEIDGLVYFVAEVPTGVESVDVTLDDGEGVHRRTVRTDQGGISSSGSAGSTTTTTP